jgi:nicotinate-nucleotide adenylyltransferase
LAIMPLRIGVFGGTFDPPHIGHLVTAVNVRAALKLDRVLFVVANIPWQKSGRRPISPAADRLALVTEAVRGLDGIEASNIEIEHGGDSVTADTLETLCARDPNAELFVILGADAAAGLPTWRRPEVVCSLATIVAVSRPGTPTGAPLSGWRWVDVEVPRLDVSSSGLRERVAKGQPLDILVPPAVIDRIRELRLYGLAA